MEKKVFCLRKVDLYQNIPEERFIKIAEEARDSYIAPQEIVYTEADKDTAIYILKEGEIELFREQNGKKIVIETLFPGDVFGDFGLKKYTHSAKTTKKSYLCRTPLCEFLKVMQSFPETMLHLMQVLAERTHEYEEKIASLSSPAKDQLFFVIQNLFYKHKKNILFRLFPIPFKISHQILANKTGLNRVTVSKLMKELQDEGKISINEFSRSIEVFQMKDKNIILE